MGRFADCDDGPTKSFLMDHRDDPEIRAYFALSFAKRPGEELYDLEKDPDQLRNLALEKGHEPVRAELSARLMTELKATGDPRATGGPIPFDDYPYRARYELNPMRQT
jgi:hypothetical protein